MTGRYIAVIGAGYWGKNLVRNFSELGVLKTICDNDFGIQRKMRAAYPSAVVTAECESVLDDPEIAGVVIATPAVNHYPLAKLALEAGKHVFVEKPLALTTPAAEDEHGCQLSIQLLNADRKVHKRLAENHIIADWREPDVIRVAPVPLYNSFEDVYIFSAKLKEALLEQ